MSDTLLLLDVDGVLSPLGLPETWPDFRPVPDAPYWLVVSPRMGEALAALPATRYWLTSWDELANEWVAPALGWSPLPVVDWPDGPGPRPHVYKLDGLGGLLRSLTRRPAAVAWCEDALIDESLRQQAEELLGDVPHHLVAPDPQVGLTPDDIAGVREFLAAHTG